MNIKNIISIKPLFSGIVTTADKEETESNGIIQLNKNSGDTSLIQTVVAVGDIVEKQQTIKVGDVVHINPIRYGKPKYKEGSLKDGVIENNFMVEYNIPSIELNGVTHLLLQDRDVDYIIKEYISENNSNK